MCLNGLLVNFWPYLDNNIDNNIKYFFTTPMIKLDLDQHSKLLPIRLLIAVVQDNSLDVLQ